MEKVTEVETYINDLRRTDVRSLLILSNSRTTLSLTGTSFDPTPTTLFRHLSVKV